MVKHMEKKLKKLIKIVMIPEIFFILVGLYLILNNKVSAIAMSYLIAILIVGKGIAFINSNKHSVKKYKIFDLVIPYGVINIIYALLLIINIYTIRVDLNITVGFYIIATSLIYLYVLFKMSNITKQIKSLLIAVFVLLIGVGIMLMTNILSEILFFSSACGTMLIFYGTLNYMALSLVKKNIDINIEIEKEKKKAQELKEKEEQERKEKEKAKKAKAKKTKKEPEQKKKNKSKQTNQKKNKENKKNKK